MQDDLNGYRKQAMDKSQKAVTFAQQEALGTQIPNENTMLTEYTEQSMTQTVTCTQMVKKISPQ